MPYSIAMVYVKLAGDKDIKSLPFVEALAIFTNVSFDYNASQTATREKGSIHYVITGDTEQAKGKTYVVSKKDVIDRLQMDIYENTEQIIDMAIQPEDYRLVPEVNQLIGM